MMGMVDYQHSDIVKLKETKFKELEVQLWFSDNAFVISEVGKDGMVSLNELDETVSASEIQSMPVNKKHAGNVYYDPIIAASIIGPDDEIPVHSTDYSYFMDHLGRVTEENGTTLRALVEGQKFKYVHEVQHWLRERYGTDDLRIHHKLITPTERCFRNLWSLRDGLLDAGVSSYQFLYEMANMLYLRWMAVSDDNEMARWKDMERAVDDDKVEKYQQAINRIKQETRIFSATMLEQAIGEVSKCAQKENIAELFDLMLQENSKTKDGGAIQNTTPKVLAQLLVKVMQPKLGERWHDPAAGFAGFLVEIDKYLRDSNDKYQTLTEEERKFQITEALSGMEFQREAARIGFCNTRFHGLWCNVKKGDSLETVDYQLYDGIICEPPIQMFSLAGKQSTGSYKNKQLEFVELILKSLSYQLEGRAAMLLPESFFYKSGWEYRHIRKFLFEQYSNHAILRLPKGIYPNTNISMCAIFLRYRPNNNGHVLIYDMQSEKLKPERLQDVSVFDGFIKAYHDGVFGKKGYILSMDQLRNDDYQINFGVDNDSEKQQMETPSYYLKEANKVVKEIRSMLSKMEKEING
jgi:type I restriction enzyme M protein